jgi:general L-amino acid transport system substrate-binding protein
LRFLAAAFLLCATTAHAATTLDAIRAAGHLSCGVVTEISDETKDDTHGDLSVLGGDFCRAVAAAVLGTHAAVVVHAFPRAALGYEALQHKDLDILVGDTPSDGLARRYGVQYTMPIFFDEQALLVRKDAGIASLKDLANKPVCFIGTTDAELRLHQATQAAGIKVGLFPFEEIGEMEAALVDGRCAAETHDASKLAVDRTGFHGMVHDFIILPDRLSIDPFAPVLRDGDPVWARIVNGVFFALVQAEQLGVTRANAGAMRANPNETVQMLLGARQGTNWGLFLTADWALHAIEAAGNYGEMLNHATGEASPLHLARGLNALAGQGGLIWAPPIR